MLYTASSHLADTIPEGISAIGRQHKNFERHPHSLEYQNIVNSSSAFTYHQLAVVS
jgi:hypothetical protein